MSNVLTITIASGIPIAGTGAVSTLDNLIGVAGTPNTNVLTIQGVSGGTVIPVSGTFWQATQPISAASLPLPTGAATAAKQPALGTAGGAAADVITVQGVASMTPLLVNPGTAANWGVVAQGSTTSGQSGTLAMGAVTTASPTYTTAQSSALSLDTTGALRVNVTAGGAGGGIVTNAGTFAVQNSAATPAGTNIIGKVGIDQTTDGTTNAVHLTAGTNIIGKANVLLNGTTPDLGPGTAGSATQRTILDSASPGIIATGTQASPSTAYLSTVAAGDVAAGSSDSGNPQKIGGVGHTANPTAVTDGQRVNAIFDKLGKQVVVGAIRDLKGIQATTITASTSETTIVTAVASTFLDLYGLVLTNSSATATVVTIKDSTAGTTRATIEVPAGDTRGFMLPVDSAIPQATVNTAWTATSSASVTSLFVTALYVKNI